MDVDVKILLLTTALLVPLLIASYYIRPYNLIQGDWTPDEERELANTMILFVQYGAIVMVAGVSICILIIQIAKKRGKLGSSH